MLSRSLKTLAVVVIVLMARAASAEESRPVAAQLLERLRTEAVLEWQAMAGKLSHCAFEYTVVETDRHGGSSMGRTKRVTGRIAGDSFLFTETIVATDQVSVYGRNERYEFALVRSGDSPWFISWQNSRRDDDTPVGSAYAYLAGMLRLPWSISATPLAKLVHHPRFSIRQVRPKDNALIEVYFAVAPAGESEDDLQGLSSGFMVLDPRRRWAIVQYQSRYGKQMSSSVNLAYGGSGPPELSRVGFKLQTRPGQSNEFAIDINKYDWSEVSDAEFTLPAFGLPDYEEPTYRRRWLRLININVGIIFVLLGLILWRRRQGHNGTA